jgi:hypothetical protein
VKAFYGATWLPGMAPVVSNGCLSRRNHVGLGVAFRVPRIVGATEAFLVNHDALQG